MTILRLLILALGGLLILGGFAAIASEDGWSGRVVVGRGRTRDRGGGPARATALRSVAAEVGPQPPGPGGGEPLDQPLEPRFSPTTERFVDPTTGVSMRVWVDATSGERRYRADR